MVKSRGTLVVCPVSLVGQWVSEAKSKLTAGVSLKIYEYHGSNRIRNAGKCSFKKILGLESLTLILILTLLQIFILISILIFMQNQILTIILTFILTLILSFNLS
jgi:SNF2 family DNA or RNA helicase